MFRLVGLQSLVTAVVALGAWALGGDHAGWSAALGGTACVVPNALFALRLAQVAHRAGRATRTAQAVADGVPPPATAAAFADAGPLLAAFFLGEFVKLALTLGLLALFAQLYTQLVWPALIVAVIAALKSYVFTPLLPR